MDKIWLNHYPDGVSPTIDPHMYSSLLEYFDQVCEKFKQCTALESFGSTKTYQQLDTDSMAFSAYLQQHLTLKKGTRVALMMPNCMQYPIALLGVLRAGGVVVNVNPLYTANELRHQLQDSGAEVIIVLANFAHTVAEVREDTVLKHIIVTELGDALSFPKNKLLNFVVKHIKRMVPAYTIPNRLSYQHAIKQGRKLTYQRPAINETDIAFLQYTGGTTGVSKGAVLTHGNIIAQLAQLKAFFDPFFEDKQEIIITALPIYHIFSLTANCLLFMSYGAKNVLITNPRDIKSFVNTLKKTPYTVITGVNTLYNALLHNEAFQQLDFSSLRYAIAGGMAAQQSVAESWHALTGVPLLEGYGLTEASPVVSVPPLNTDRYTGSVGLPIPSTEVAICDPEGHELPQGEVGELWVKGPQVMQAYWQSPEETAEVIQNGWLLTGDIATIDEKGYLRLVDRKKDMILVSGFNVYPNEIEEILVQHPGVLEAGVIGVPCEQTGERVKAVIIKKDANDEDVTEQIIIDHCRQHLTAYKIPKQIEFRPDLPKNNVGKILRRELR